MEIRFEWDERGLEAFKREAVEAALNQGRREIEAKLRHLRCPIHDATPTVNFVKTGENLTAEITGCCDALVNEAEAALD